VYKNRVVQVRFRLRRLDRGSSSIAAGNSAAGPPKNGTFHVGVPVVAVAPRPMRSALLLDASHADASNLVRATTAAPRSEITV
jgi:hypothetical protein